LDYPLSDFSDILIVLLGFNFALIVTNVYKRFLIRVVEIDVNDGLSSLIKDYLLLKNSLDAILESVEGDLRSEVFRTATTLGSEMESVKQVYLPDQEKGIPISEKLESRFKIFSLLGFLFGIIVLLAIAFENYIPQDIMHAWIFYITILYGLETAAIYAFNPLKYRTAFYIFIAACVVALFIAWLHCKKDCPLNTGNIWVYIFFIIELMQHLVVLTFVGLKDLNKRLAGLKSSAHHLTNVAFPRYRNDIENFKTRMTAGVRP